MSSLKTLKAGRPAPSAIEPMSPANMVLEYVPTDSTFATSWHLNNTTYPGIDINVTRVWDDYTGRGVSVGVFDDAVDYRHSELDANYDASKHLVIGGVTYDALPKDTTSSGDVHGTSVAGVIAAENNGTGTVGVAYHAKLTGVPIIRSSSAASTLIAMQAQKNFDVVNHSWGYSTAYTADYGSSSYWASFRDAIIDATANGRGGLGTIIVKSGGNERSSGHDVNVDNFRNDHHVITVASINKSGFVSSFSNPGAALLVSAPGESIQTLDLPGSAGKSSGDYRSFSGTSASTPVVSGVAALILDANPNLGWRDVQEILAYSAKHVGSDIGTTKSGYEKYNWSINGAENWNGGGLHFSNDYGFGLVDALGAVRLAETWTARSVSANEAVASATGTFNVAIPDGSSTGVSRTFSVSNALNIDHVELAVDIAHAKKGDLVVTLTSPDGTVSTLVNRPVNGSATGNLTFTLQSNAFWGEDSNGTWTVKVADLASGNTGTLRSATLKVYGDTASANDTYVYTNEYAAFSSGDRATLSDGSGTDTLNAAAVTTGSTINLTPGSVSTIAGKSLTIASSTTIEHAHGGDGNDTIIGNNATNNLYGHRGDDILTGGAGNDLLDGGQGFDTARFAGSRSNYTVTDLGGGRWTVADHVGSGGTDTLVSIEQLLFDINDPTPTPTPTPTPSDPATGVTLYGTSSADTMTGGSGDDIFMGSNGVDHIDGGAGFDIVDYSASQASVNLETGVNKWYQANGDVLVNIEGLRGGAAADVFVGDIKDNLLSGGGGNDKLTGAGGSDTLEGGAGSDIFYYRQIDESRVGAADRILDFTHGQDKIDLSAIDAKAGTTTNDAFHFIGNQAFTGQAGELHYALFDQAGTANDYTLIQGDVNGDRVADFEIMLHGQLIQLQSSDFTL